LRAHRLGRALNHSAATLDGVRREA
jgi:hypothetical protein